MAADKFRPYVQEIFSSAGIRINGGEPWDIHVRDDRFYRRALKEGSLGLGEAYMDGWWECEDLAGMFYRLVPTQPETKLRKNWKLRLYMLHAAVMNTGRRSKAFEIGRRHYDLGNDLYGKMLDKRMVYSCAYWKDANNLDDAQEAKLDLICRKLGLKSGDRVLDIGCGWGGFAKYAAENFGVSVVGVTVSKEQADLAREFCGDLPVEIRLQDYRDLEEKFDHIVSVGMFEHVGYKNHRTYMETVSRCLKDEGLFLLHTIGDRVSRLSADPWLDKYIFPNSLIPSMKQISSACEGLFITEDLQNIGFNYDATLMSWFRNFDDNWEALKAKYGDRFYRMWKYYLLSSAGSFRSRSLQVWQIVYSANGVAGGYKPVR